MMPREGAYLSQPRLSDGKLFISQTLAVGWHAPCCVTQGPVASVHRSGGSKTGPSMQLSLPDLGPHAGPYDVLDRASPPTRILPVYHSDNPPPNSCPHSHVPAA